MNQSKLHVYYGDGKGKTSAAIGLCVRACGAAMRVGWASFLKDGTSSEIAVLHTLERVTVYPFLKQVKFSFCMSPEEHASAYVFYQTLLQQLQNDLPSFDVLVLDEILDAMDAGLLSEEALLRLIACAEHTELVITGHRLPDSVSASADYITYMHAERHPYENGLTARRGIEY